MLTCENMAIREGGNETIKKNIATLGGWVVAADGARCEREWGWSGQLLKSLFLTSNIPSAGYMQ